MSEVTSYLVETYREVLTCDCGHYMECGDESVRLACMTNPPTYRHDCLGCGKTELRTQRYPKIIHRQAVR